MKLNLIQLFLQQQLVRVGKHLGLSIILFWTIPTVSVKAQQLDWTWRGDLAVPLAQITPDGTLPTSVSQQENSININGGARAGNNLFHSFAEFSVPENIEAVFNNASSIENIFSRITGESISTIDGILKTQGSANLFLINPNGIVFGKNAQLDVGGSFLATTAEAIQFEDGIEFSTLREQQAPILTVSVPIGLRFGNNPGDLTVGGTGSNIKIDPQTFELIKDNRPEGLSVKPDRTLALVGGDINLEGGNLTAPAGTIELGSVGSEEIVGLVGGNSQWQLNYQGVEKFQDIELSQAASADASGNGSGSIRVNARQVNLLGRSIILIETIGNNLGGEIGLKASESMDLILSSIRNITNTSSRGGNTLIETKNLRLTDGAQIFNVTYGEGNSGSLNIIAENIEVVGVDPLESVFPSTIGTDVSPEARGNGGDVTIEAERLRLSNSGQIQATTLGSGDAGNLNVTASDIEITGGSTTLLGPSGIGTLAFPESTGNGGDLTIETERLFLGEQTQLNTATLGAGDGGNLLIKAEQIELTGSTASLGRNGLFASAIFGDGNGGNINVFAELLNIKDGATISTSNFQSLNLLPPGTGSPGNIQIDAETIILNEGSITASTLEGDRGNIVLDANNILLLDGSQITIDAESTDGGNLDLDADSLTILDGSIISANALMGEGGNIQIDTTGLFQSAEATIEASSELGIDGTVQINTPDLDLQRELEQSELEIFAAESAIALSCLAGSNQQGSLNLTNAGGVPKSPESNYSDASFSLTGVGSPPVTNPKLPRANSQQQQLSVIPAAKMVETQEGRIFLVAAPQEAESLVCQPN